MPHSSLGLTRTYTHLSLTSAAFCRTCRHGQRNLSNTVSDTWSVCGQRRRSDVWHAHKAQHERYCRPSQDPLLIIRGTVAYSLAYISEPFRFFTKSVVHSRFLLWTNPTPGLLDSSTIPLEAGRLSADQQWYRDNRRRRGAGKSGRRCRNSRSHRVCPNLRPWKFVHWFVIWPCINPRTSH